MLIHDFRARGGSGDMVDFGSNSGGTIKQWWCLPEVVVREIGEHLGERCEIWEIDAENLEFNSQIQNWLSFVLQWLSYVM